MCPEPQHPGLTNRDPGPSVGYSAKSIVVPDDYREWLRQILESRRRTNPRYSLRAFARDLDLSPSRLSQILQGRQGLSPQSCEALVPKLGLDAELQSYFSLLVQAQDARSKAERQRALEKISQVKLSAPYIVLSEERFRFISDWQHLAILELLASPHAESSFSWISSRLGISEEHARAAVDRLFVLQLLTLEDKKWIPTSKQLSTSADVPSKAIRRFNSQILKMAEASLETQDPLMRDISTLVVGISEEQLPELKALLVNFRRSFYADAVAGRKRAKSKDRKVYALNLSFFSLEKQQEPSPKEKT